MKTKPVTYFTVLILVASVVFAYFYSKNKTCTGLELELENYSQDVLVNRALAENVLKQQHVNWKHIKVSDINLTQIETTLSKISTIEKVDASFKFNGAIKLNVKQRIPVLCIIDKQGNSYHVNSDGLLLKPDSNSLSRVVVASGIIFDNNLKYGFNINTIVNNDSLKEKSILDDLFTVGLCLEKDTFLKAQIEQVYVNDLQELVLIPKLGGQKIILGDASFCEKKFRTLKVFYDNVCSQKGWDYYKVIDLKYRNQIVCLKSTVTDAK